MYFRVDDLFSFGCLFHSFFEVLINHLLKIIDIVEERVVDLVHSEVDVSKNNDVDKEHQSVLAPMNNLFNDNPAYDEVRRTCQADHDISAIHMIGEVLIRHSSTLENL